MASPVNTTTQEEETKMSVAERTVIYLAVLLLAGCAAPRSYEWVHDRGADISQLRRDQGQCEAQAMQHPLTPVEQGMEIYASCMRGRGWSLRER